MKTKFFICCSLLALSGYASAFELSSTQSSLLSPDKEILPDENGVTVTYTFKGALSTEDNLYPGTYNLSIPGFGNNSCSGQAAWPVRWDSFVIPDGCEASVQLVSVTTESRNMRIAPSRLPLIDSSDEVYSTDNVMPVEPFSGIMPTANISADGTGNYRDRNILYVKVAPVTYSYESGTTYFAKTLSYRVTFSQSRKAMAKDGDKTTRHTVDDEMMRKMFTYYKSESVDNSGLSKSISSATFLPAPYYLILSVSKYKSAVDRLAAWKRIMGFNVKTIYQDSWTPKAITSTVTNQYNSLDSLDYLLIVGDEVDLPGTRREDDYTYATDYRYGCMSGDKDSIADLYMGRLSVENLSQANIVVNKIINYEKNPPKLSSFYTNAAHCAEFQDLYPTNCSEDRRFVRTCEDIRNGLLNKGIDIERIYYYNKGRDTIPTHNPKYWNKGDYGKGETIPEDLMWPTFPWDGNAQDVSEAINNGIFYLLHRDHGSKDGWGQPSFKSSHITSLNNGELLPVVFSMNCSTGKYQEPNNTQRSSCFAENFLRKQNGGCVAIIAASQTSYSGLNDALTMEIFSQIWPEQNIRTTFPGYCPDRADGIGTSNARIGQALHFGKQGMEQFYGKDLYTKELFHCFGDPSMRIYTKEPVPTPYNCSVPVNIASQETILSIKSPILITLTKIFIGGRVETASGFSFNIPITSNVETIYAHAPNYIPQEVYTRQLTYNPSSLSTAQITGLKQNGDNLAISYEINEEETGDVKIQLSSIDECGNVFYSCDTTEKQLDVDVSGKKRGFYVVSLIVNGKNVDNKKLMIK